MSPKERVVATALEAGASAVRVTGANADELGARRLDESFSRGDLAAWPYDADYARAASDPRSLLPGARSVICIAVAYARDAPAAEPLTGRVSNYAWSADYHRSVRAILERVRDLLATLGAETRIACDTAPLAERIFAERAGLGWVGKHTNLIVPRKGSFVFLGEAVTTYAFDPDPPLRKSCGSCTRCVTVCPTGALRGDYTIDANRCISDLTQRRGIIPRELRPFIADWIWGCDLCQEVCPPTKLAGTSADRRFTPLRGLARPDLLELLQLRPAEFRRRFAASAMGWRGPAILRRNAAVALGNSLDRSIVPALEETVLRDPNPLVRLHAVWALGRIGSPRAFSFLGKRLDVEEHSDIREEIEAALVTVASSRAL